MGDLCSDCKSLKRLDISNIKINGRDYRGTLMIVDGCKELKDIIINKELKQVVLVRYLGVKNSFQM